jgi:hypothetical protein
MVFDDCSDTEASDDAVAEIFFALCSIDKPSLLYSDYPSRGTTVYCPEIQIDLSYRNAGFIKIANCVHFYMSR